MRPLNEIRSSATAAAVAALCLAAPCLAAPAALPRGARDPAPQAAIPEILVTGERTGPGLWHVNRGAAQLWILGTVNPLPKDLRWRSRQIEQILGGANAVVMAKPLDIGIVRVLWLLLTRRDLLMVPRGAELRAVLPADLYARFAAQRAKYTGNPHKWERYRPIIAVAFLQEAALHSVGLSTRLDVGAEVRKLARRHDVRVEQIKLAGWRDALDALKTLPPDVEDKCVAAVLATVERGLPRLVERAHAWATGDIRRIQSLPYAPEVDACRTAVNGGTRAADLIAQIRRTWLASLDQHLRQKGVTLAVVNMDLLLEPGGLLDQLRSQGYAVQPP